MKRIRLAAAVIAILVIPHISKAGQITYSLQNYAADQNGSTLTGSVTTDGNLGTLTSADIVSWTWTITGPVGPPVIVSGSASDAGVVGLLATTQELLLPASVGGTNEFFLGSLNSVTPEIVTWIRRTPSDGGNLYYAYSVSSYIWDTSDPAMGGTDPWVIGVSASVPEPSSVALLGLGITGLLAYARSQARRKQRD